MRCQELYAEYLARSDAYIFAYPQPLTGALQAELQSALLGDKDPQQALDDAASKASSLLDG